ncbi:MAG: hypothetical protein WB586_18265 [Chthoniobacterales bacterium]
MAPKFGDYLFRNLKGESANSPIRSGRELSAELVALEERAIILRETDFLSASHELPLLDWSQPAEGQIRVELKDMQGVMDGRASVSATALRRVCPGLLAPEVKDEILFPVSLKAVVLQIQAYLNSSPGELIKFPGPDFDTPIAQVAREDESFFKLEKAAQSAARPASPPREKVVQGPALTPADRPPFPLIREKPRNEPPPAEAGPIEVALPPIAQSPPEAALGSTPKVDPFAGLPKVGRSSSQTGSTPSPLCQQSATVASRTALSGACVRTDRIDPADEGRRRLPLERLQEIFITDDFLDVARVAKLLSTFPKVKGAVIVLEPGRILASELPNGFELETTLAAPSLIRAVRQFTQALCQSDACGLTILADLPISVFQEGKICVLIAHDGRGLLPGMKERVTDVAKALDAMYDTRSEPTSESLTS